MTCRYRAGDALVQVGNFLVLFVVSIKLGSVDHWLWFSLPILMALYMLIAARINVRSREQDDVRAIRAQRQLALGVPPDEG